MCLVKNIIVFFYGYVYESYNDNNVHGRFAYLSGYGGNGTNAI